MIIAKGLRGLLTLVLCAQLIGPGAVAPAWAGTVDTGAYLAREHRAERVERVQAFLAGERVRDRLEALGVAPEDAAARVAALSDAELAQLDARIADLPAGGNVVALVGAVFVVLLILELLGVTNVFTAI